MNTWHFVVKTISACGCGLPVTQVVISRQDLGNFFTQLTSAFSGG
jgi:hypothetical protein